MRTRSQTKYGNMLANDEPIVSKHASERWHGSGDDNKPPQALVPNREDPIDAWKRAHRIRPNKGYDPEEQPVDADEVRYDSEQQVVLLRKDTHIVTIYSSIGCKETVRSAIDKFLM